MSADIFLAQTNFGEFAREPILTVACVLLIVVSISWIVVSRMIVRQLKRYEASRPRKRPETRRSKRVRDPG